ncbi:hypothetical protein F4780DRAFT_775514 [Xylariomycetidae sp. FL0641]|nr:hypothetical protein F4780DRAFT_775514 [Xylariomycetidae sp. FL0641]
MSTSPENMNNLSRHVACKSCRERKVRCDGAQPTCEKCRRSGDTCIYVPTHKPTKADLAQTIESLQQRLGKAEAYIMNTSPSKKSTPERQMGTPNSVGMDYMEYSPFGIHMPSTTPAVEPFMPTTFGSMPFTNTLPLPSPESLDSEFMRYLPSPEGTPGTSSTPCSWEGMFDPLLMPNMGEISAPTSMSSRSTPSLSSSPPVGTRASTNTSKGEDANKILAELTAFAMAVFQTQAEMAGISAVVAEYLALVRSNQLPSDNQHKQLEVLERRVRELHGIASSRHREAWRNSLRMLENVPGAAAMLRLFDNEMTRRSQETAEFFRGGRYDVEMPLAEQKSKKE